MIFWHITVVSQEVINQGNEGTVGECGRLLPSSDVGVELGPWLDRRSEDIDTGELGNNVLGRGEKFVVPGHSASEFAKIGKVNERCGNDTLGGGDFIFGEGAEHRVEFQDKL